MGFPQYDSHNQVGNPSSNYLLPTQLSIIKNNNNDMEFPLYQSSKEGLFFDSVNDQNTPNNNNNFELPNTLQAIKSQLNGDLQCNGSPEKSNKIPCGNFPPNNFLPIEQHKLFIDDAAPLTRNISIPKANQESMAQLNFSSQQEKLSPTISAGSMSTATGHGSLVSNGPIASSKTRIRWTQDLHEKFVECVNRLGGAEKATPKAILRLMDSDGLTIFHVKSHLQKYRIAKYMPESTLGKSEKRTNAESVHLDVKAGLQIKEALQLQLDVQRRLHEQLEIQRKLQLQIEEQGKQLKMMFDRQQKSNNIENSSKYNNNNEVTILEGTGISYFPTKKS
ncbi:hypothetical protein PIB30_003632 [Stylosanthes scabra]|uniref:HTH myb-type domain-containing protein n=1 Tax=Stylosanthes scabra TaxID=79078 RepID=A0ABU6Y3P7_9FABA|nr:hypothetical protein [Stylosanthes scabra]